MIDKDPEVVIDDSIDLPMDFDIVEVKKEEPKVEVKVEADKPKTEDDPIESLRRQLDEAKAEAAREADRASKAERSAQEYATKANVATSNTLASQIDSVDSNIALYKAEADRAEREYAAAQEVADYAAAAKAQRAMARAEGFIQRLEDGKAELQHRQKVAKEPARREAPVGVDGMIDGIIEGSSPQAQDYVRRNRGRLASERDIKKLIASHELASIDHKLDSDGYFEAIDKQMGWTEQESKPAPKAQSRTVSAPVGRDTARANGDLSGNRVTLSSEQVALAKEMGISPAAYAKNMLKIKANGKDPHATGPRFSNDIR